ncbi:hypothetical protein Barb4_03037 [Bacteroidales bacterium Barb4]|nr:hypothetical protein Barb4_03037 [Bacteroidales bacterium Barb4]
MDAKQYIRNELEKLIVSFPNVRVRYEYDKNAIVHFVEVVPNEIYHLDNDYIAWENKMTDKFIELFPTQNICFISDDALVGIENEEYVLYRTKYMEISTDKKAIIIDPANVVLQQKTLKDWTKITFIDDDCCGKDNPIENCTISGNYTNENNQNEYYLAA